MKYAKEEVLTLEEGWSLMEKGIVKLQNYLEMDNWIPFSPEEYMKLYTVIYDLCTQKGQHDNLYALYNRYRETFENYYSSKVLPALNEKHYVYLLAEFLKRWNSHKIHLRWLFRFFYYLDRYYIPHKNLPNLNEVGRRSFFELVFNASKDRVKNVIIALIDKERQGEKIDRTLVKNVLSIFVEVHQYGHMGFYENDFEKTMLDETTNYYAQKASEHINVDSCLQYMLMAEECLASERERAIHYLAPSSQKKLLETTQHELLLLHANQLLEKEETGFHALLRDDEVEHLSRVYKLFSNIAGGLEPVAEKFKMHVTEEGLALVKCAEDASGQKEGSKDTLGLQDLVFVRKLIELHDRYMPYVNKCFMSHSLFHKALKEAFEVFCNKSVAENTSAELLANFCDNMLKKGGGSEKLSDDAVEETLDKVVALIAYIHDKDLYGEFCRKKLARRLLFDRSGSEDHERSLITKLKQQWGGQFTSKMEGMLMNLTLARESQHNFMRYLKENPREYVGLDLFVSVLGSGFWPSYKSSDLNIPQEMVSAIEVFKKYYHSRLKHRKLAWIFSLGTCTIIGRFIPKPIELIVTTYQAATLLLFNNSERLSYQEIALQLNLGDDVVNRLLHSLSCMKYRILKKEPSSKIISKSDIFEFNTMFTDKMRRIKIPLPLMDEKEKVIEDVDKDRRCTIDAAVVRIMKGRKVLGFQQLVTECVGQLNHLFKPDLKLIKKRIEDLIEREYMRKDWENPTMLEYIA